jgi:hypothetical protein
VLLKNNSTNNKPFIMANITTSNWEAWVNLMPPRPTPGGTLHVTGDVNTHSSDMAYLEKAIPQGKNPAILLLNLNTVAGTVPANNPQKVHYHEELQQKDQYSSIEILYEGERIAMIDEIKEVQ